jgi:hypothetical protein
VVDAERAAARRKRPARFSRTCTARFARGNELLRHFWGAFPVVSRASLAKATRVAAARCDRLSVELDAARRRACR